MTCHETEGQNICFTLVTYEQNCIKRDLLWLSLSQKISTNIFQFQTNFKHSNTIGFYNITCIYIFTYANKYTHKCIHTYIYAYTHEYSCLCINLDG